MNYEDRVTKQYLEDAIANAGAKIVVGTYTGDGQPSQFIDLGATPKALYVCRDSGLCFTAGSGSRSYYGGLALPGHINTVPGVSRLNIMAIEAGGFRVYNGSDTASSVSEYVSANSENATCFYIALL